MSEEKKIEEGVDKALNATANVYSTMDALDIANDTRPKPKELWGGFPLLAGQIMEIIGGSGVGKSRISLNLAFNQIMGCDFGGLEMYKEKQLNWLFYGNENSFFRFRDDIQAMLKTVPKAEHEKLRNHLFLPTMDKPEDIDISLADENNVEKLRATILLHKADVVVMDPWGAIIAGDELSDGDVRDTIRLISRILQECSAKLGNNVVAIILNHSRNGLNELINCCGAEAPNFGKNSKAIYTVVRTVWNLRPCWYSEDDVKFDAKGNPSHDVDWIKGIEFYHAKFSDGIKYDPFAVEMQQGTHIYTKVSIFNHAVFQRLLELIRLKRGTLDDFFTGKKAKEQVDRVFEKMVVEHLGSLLDKIISKITFDSFLSDVLHIAQNKRNAFKEQLEKRGLIVTLKRGTQKFVGLTDRVEEFLKTDPDADEYKREITP